MASARFQLDGCTVPEGQFTCNNEDWEQITWGYTDPSGYYYLLGCGQGVEEYWSMVWTHAGGDSFQVYGGYAQQWGLVAADCGSSYDMVVPSNPARVFLNLRKTVEGSSALFGVSRPFINVSVLSCSSSFYSPTSDEITICTGSVWGAWGTFIAAHEYGHAFHEAALWGNTGSACSTHFLDTESSQGCAFSEGFADYFGGAVRPDLVTYSYRGYFEDDSYFPGCVERLTTYPYTCIGGTSYEGSVIEGAFAAFLHDLTDAVAEPHDSIAAPGTYVRDLIRTCQVLYPSASWRRANGADEIAYCAENAINPGTYFTRRGQYPVAYSESATEGGGWTSARVHRSWTWNMYEKP